MTDINEKKKLPALLQPSPSNSGQEQKDSLVTAMNEMEAMRKRALQYSAQLSKLLNEACTILETLEITVEVSEPLQCWWEREKRKKETKNVSKVLSHSGNNVRDLSGLVSRDAGLVSASGTPIIHEQETEP